MSPDRELRAAGPLLVAAGLVVIASVSLTARERPENVRALVAFGLFIAIGEVLRITLSGGRQTAPLASAGAVAFGRARQVTKKGRAAALRAKLASRAAAAKRARKKPRN